MFKLLATLLSLLVISALHAQQMSDQLIDVPVLTRELENPKLVLLQLSGKDVAPGEHIPGTRLITVKDFSSPNPGDQSTGVTLALELPSAETLRENLSALGISDDSRIVVYADGGVQTLPMATRLLFTLQYFGLGHHAALLNGGLQAWKQAGQPTTTELGRTTPGHLSALKTQPLAVDAKWVSEIGSKPGYRLVDARLPKYFNGVEVSMGGSGHIPGAVNIPFSDLADAEGKLDLSKISVVFHKAGIKKGDTVVTYCHIGAQATTALFAAQLLGNPVLLYDGSWQDWVQNHRGPMIK